MLRPRLNCRVMLVDPSELQDVISLTPEIDPNARSNGAATLAAMVERGGRSAFELSRPRSDGGTLYLKVEAGCVGDLLSVTMTDVGDIKAREASLDRKSVV